VEADSPHGACQSKTTSLSEPRRGRIGPWVGVANHHAHRIDPKGF
jgi:hypothetical protein